MDEKDIAWLAGIVEGEGWITFPKNSSNGVAIGVKMSDQDIIHRIYSLTGFGSVSFSNRSDKNPNHKDVWTWTVGARDQVRNLILLLLPWMGNRRSEKMKLALVRLENNRGYSHDIEHGTVKGYKAEGRKKIPHCDKCKKASSDDSKRRYEEKKNERLA